MLGFEVSGDVAVLTLANPPVNSLGLELRRGIVEALERAEDTPSVKAVVIIGSGKGFSGGADIREFGTPKALAAPNLPALLRTIEDCAKPVVAAIDGICMGGGFELALACHYRVAAADAQLGAARGQARAAARCRRHAAPAAPVGVQHALNMIVSGNTVTAEELGGTALLDAVVPADKDLRGRCRGLRPCSGSPRGAARSGSGICRIDMPDAEAYLQFARNTVKAAAGPYPAPPACVEAVVAAVKGPFEAGLKRERELFVTLMASPGVRGAATYLPGRACCRPHQGSAGADSRARRQ